MHKVSEFVRSTHGQDGAIVLDVRRGQIFNVNLVGSRILALIEFGSCEAEIVNVISREFDVDRKLVENDVGQFIDTLKEHRLVKEIPRTDAVGR